MTQRAVALGLRSVLRLTARRARQLVRMGLGSASRFGRIQPRL